MEVKRLGILTGGGDCAGLNAVIRAVTKCAAWQYGMQVIGIRDGFSGLIGKKRTMNITPSMVKGLLTRGGTILGSSNKANPFANKQIINGRMIETDHSDEVIQNLHDLEIDCLLIVGGIALMFYMRTGPMTRRK